MDGLPNIEETMARTCDDTPVVQSCTPLFERPLQPTVGGLARSSKSRSSQRARFRGLQIRETPVLELRTCDSGGRVAACSAVADRTQ